MVFLKKAVQSGNVEDAIEKVNDLNPEVLDTNPNLCFHLQQQRLIELIWSHSFLEDLERSRGPLLFLPLNMSLTVLFESFLIHHNV
ncbi:Glucose-induced degradation complex subunit [Stylosanthes scabra]|uniref:Glucose-induced degradation complex subunit n=1 Tax=Stylosanthes scabra TaxID=79078 RepID=A0ABU6TCK5_9FABA|nr:Glucose-induced degradation complex subunit [Stylosanthes scabra]